MADQETTYSSAQDAINAAMKIGTDKASNTANDFTIKDANRDIAFIVGGGAVGAVAGGWVANSLAHGFNANKGWTVLWTIVGVFAGLSTGAKIGLYSAVIKETESQTK